jgi:hypothetical protein
MNHERLRVTRFRKAKVQEGPAFVPIAKQMKAVAMPIQIAEPVQADEYYRNGYFQFPPLRINIPKRHCKSFIKLLADTLYANKKRFKFKDYICIYDNTIVTCIHFPPICLSVMACLFANELYKRQGVTTWYDGRWFRLTVLC